MPGDCHFEGDSNVASARRKRGRLSKDATASTSSSSWGKAAPVTLTLKLDNSVLLRVSLVPLKLPPQGWSSEQVSHQKVSLCVDLLRGELDTSALVPLSHHLRGFSQPGFVGTSLPGTGTLA